MELRHDRPESRCKISSHGVLTKHSFTNDQLVYKEMRDIVTNLAGDIQTSFANQFIYIKFGRVPHFVVDPVMCLLI
jgi:hypothetical protein